MPASPKRPGSASSGNESSFPGRASGRSGVRTHRPRRPPCWPLPQQMASVLIKQGRDGPSTDDHWRAMAELARDSRRCAGLLIVDPASPAAPTPTKPGPCPAAYGSGTHCPGKQHVHHAGSVAAMCNKAASLWTRRGKRNLRAVGHDHGPALAGRKTGLWREPGRAMWTEGRLRIGPKKPPTRYLSYPLLHT